MEKREEQRITEILMEYKKQIPSNHSKYPHTVNKILEYIHLKIFTKRFRNNDFKECSHNNSNNIISLFRYHIGKTPKKFISFCRIEAAKLILADKQLKNVQIYTIARRLGFSGKGDFNHAFKKRTGLSPEKWRKQLFSKE